jgi:tetratricopeptide (TPR) repeat protein
VNTLKPLCFILMPFGRKPSPNGSVVAFDRVYAELIAPAVADAELEPLRADEETVGGIIHKPMFERLILCPYAVADLTLANANVFYELGVRHAFRPWSTVPIIAEDSRLPFDVQMLRTVQYKLGADGGPDPAQVDRTRKSIANLLIEARKGQKDSPIFQLVDGLQEPTMAHEKTDVFRNQVQYSNQVKGKLAAARKQGADAVRQLEKELAPIADMESGVVIDLYLSYRATSAWQEMVDLAERMAAPLAETILVREQLGFALNRLKRRDEAEAALTKLIEERGPSSETLGILGRVYKDWWEEARRAGDDMLAQGYLDKAIEAYLSGFEADWRDAYPGVNAVTLMEIKNPPDKRQVEILPVVRYAVERKIARGKPDYWDYATLVELAILASDQAEAMKVLSKALACVREQWELETTARNLSLIREARERRGSVPAWTKDVEETLRKRANA